MLYPIYFTTSNSSTVFSPSWPCLKFSNKFYELPVTAFFDCVQTITDKERKGQKRITLSFRRNTTVKAADLSNVSQPVRSKQVAKFLRVNRLAIKILAVELKCRGLQSKLSGERLIMKHTPGLKPCRHKHWDQRTRHEIVRYLMRLMTLMTNVVIKKFHK